MPDFTDDEIHAVTRDFIIGSVRAIDDLDIGTLMTRDARFNGTFDAEFREARGRIAEAKRTATVTVSWPAEPGTDPDASSLLDVLLAGAHDGGPVQVPVLREDADGREGTELVDAAGCQTFVNELLAWHRDGVERRTAALESQLAQLRHIIDAQAQKLENYAQQHIADAKRIVELEDALDLSAIDTALRRGRDRVNLTVGYGVEDGQDVFTVILFDDGPECEDVMGPMPGDGSTSVLATGQAPTLAEALARCAAHMSTAAAGATP